MNLNAPHLRVASFQSVRMSFLFRGVALFMLVVPIVLLSLEMLSFRWALAMLVADCLLVIAVRFPVLRTYVTQRKLNGLLLGGIKAYQEGRLRDAEGMFDQVAMRTWKGVFNFHVPSVTWLAVVRLAEGAPEDARVLLGRLEDPAAATHACRPWVRASVSMYAAILAALDRDVARAEKLLAQAASEDVSMTERSLTTKYLVAVMKRDGEMVRALAERAEAQWELADRGVIDRTLLAALVAFAEHEVGSASEATRWGTRLFAADLIHACACRKGLLEAPRWPELRAFVDEAIGRNLVAPS